MHCCMLRLKSISSLLSLPDGEDHSPALQDGIFNVPIEHNCSHVCVVDIPIGKFVLPAQSTFLMSDISATESLLGNGTCMMHSTCCWLYWCWLGTFLLIFCLSSDSVHIMYCRVQACNTYYNCVFLRVFAATEGRIMSFELKLSSFYQACSPGFTRGMGWGGGHDVILLINRSQKSWLHKLPVCTHSASAVGGGGGGWAGCLNPPPPQTLSWLLTNTLCGLSLPSLLLEPPSFVLHREKV